MERYVHQLTDWPDFRWDAEAVADSLAWAGRRQVQIVGKVLLAGPVAATEATVCNLTESAVASSRIEGEHPDPRNIGASIRRHIAAESGHAVQRQRGEPGIALVTADASTNHGEPLTVERLHRWHRHLFPGPNPVSFAAGRWRDDRLGPMRVVSRGPIGRTPITPFEAPVVPEVYMMPIRSR